MTLGSEHVETADFADLFSFLLRGGTNFSDLFVPCLFVFFRGFHRVEATLTQINVGNDVGVTTKHDVSTTAGHVGGHGDSCGATRLSNDLGFFFVVLCVQHTVANALGLQQLREVLRALHRGSTNENGLPLGDALFDVFRNRTELCFLGLIDQVGTVFTTVRTVGRNLVHIKLVDLVKLAGLSFSGTGHTGKLVVKAEVVLQRNGSQGLVFSLDLYTFFSLDGLVHTFVITATCQHATGELVDDHHFTVTDDVVLIAREEFFSLDGVIEIAHQLRILWRVEVVDT